MGVVSGFWGSGAVSRATVARVLDPTGGQARASARPVSIVIQWIQKAMRRAVPNCATTAGLFNRMCRRRV